MTAQAEVGVWLVAECPIENGTLLKTERVVSLHATADEALSEVRRQSKIMRDNDLRGYLYGYKFYPVPGLLAQQPAPASEELKRLRAAITKIANLQANSPEACMDSYDHIATVIGEVVDEYGCDDCRGKTFEDGSVCCWTCGRVLPDALSAAEAPAGRDT